MGHQFGNQRYMGDAEGVMIEVNTDVRLGGSDPRLDGKSIGY
jgi:gamma-glutamyltranspeptidase